MATTSPDLCPTCGAERPANAPRGLCPRCLLRRGFESGPPSVLETLIAAVGSVPRVLLRDTNAGSEPPVDQPSSPELCPLAHRSARLRLLGEIARGGMGAVLRGRDEDLGRDLAVKVLLETHREKPELVRRFVEEAQIAGQLQHPGIVPIYELGAFADRRPFFTMKLVKGRTLADLLRDREDPDGDLPRLLVIFEAVCQTVAYAHTRSVIHRDLKPSNVMVGGFGEVQVMDWGLAKVLSRSGVADDAAADKARDHEPIVVTRRSGQSGSDADSERSRAGSVMGTPAYMAPEQARGEVERVDERADVFALGSILCEILTGQPAFGRGTSDEIQRRAARGEMADALKRLDASGAEAEMVELARGCLAPAPRDRPRDAAAVTTRLIAYQRGVQERLRTAELARAAEAARAEEASHTAEAERRARRLTAALAAAVIGLLVLGGGGYGWTLHQRAQRRVRTAAVVDEALAEAARLRGAARATSGDAGSWAEALAAARRAEGALAQGEADAPLRRRVAELVASLVRERDAAATGRRLLAALETIRGSRALHGDLARTDAEYAAAFRAAGMDLDATDPRAAGAWVAARSEPVELASYLDDWASVRRGVDFFGADWRRLVASARAADPAPWRDDLRQRIATQDMLEGDESGQTAAGFRALADDDASLDAQPAASLVLLATHLRDVIDDRARTEAVLRRAWRRYPGDFWVNFQLAHALGKKVGHQAELYPRPDEAVRFLTAAVAIRPGSSMARISLGSALSAAGDQPAAVAAYREMIRLQPRDARTYVRLGDALRFSGDTPSAVAEYREAIRLDPGLGVAHWGLGSALHELGDLEGAIAENREALRLAPRSALFHNAYGLALRQKEDLEGAIAEFREAVRLRPDLEPAHTNLGLALQAAGDLSGAAAEYREAILLNRRSLQLPRPLGATIPEYREAIRLKPDDALAHNNLADALLERRDPSAAMAAVQEALRLYPNQANSLSARGRILLVGGRFAEALPDLERAHARFAESRQPEKEKHSADLIPPVRWLVDHESELMALASDGRRDRAELTCLDLAALARDASRPALAARLYQVAFAASPTLADGRRLDAARAAARAAGGQGEDHPPPDGAAKVTLRRQALDCLKAELAALSRSLDPADPRSRATITETLERWKSDPDLAGVGGTKALGTLPEDERREWRAYWSQVESLGKKAGRGAL